jgi:thiamine biosynthesis lipoprotein
MPHAAAATVALDWVEHVATAMGGNLTLQVRFQRTLNDAERAHVSMVLSGLAARVNGWSSLATRHHPSQLTALNADPNQSARIGPTLTSMLAWAAEAYELTGGLVDVGLLTQRVAAETLQAEIPRPNVDRGWIVDAEVREFNGNRLICGGSVTRPLGMKFDLDGVGKGWIVDRAIEVLTRQLDTAGATRALPDWSSCFVDGDGDIAFRHRGGAETVVSVQVPRTAEAEIGQLTIAGESGVATSGTGVHRWGGRHHLIDPRTGEPSNSGIAQATVVASSARLAEAWAKAIVIDGAASIRRAEASGVARIVAISDQGSVVTAPLIGASVAPFRPREGLSA